MKVLLDTHTFIWLASEPEKLSAEAQRTCESADLLLSVVSVWEMAIKVRLGRIELVPDLSTFIRTRLQPGQISILPVNVDHALRVSDLPLGAHRDPFDRMLAAQSIEEELPLVTRDPAFQDYQVNTIW